MARQRTRVRVARALRAVILGGLAAGTATALFEWDYGRDLEVPVGLLAAAPPVIYLVLAGFVMSEAPPGRRFGWAMAACGVNAAIGLATTLTLAVVHPLSFEGAILRAFGAFVPAPMISLAAAPIVLLAFRSRVQRPRAAARRERDPWSLPRTPSAPLPTVTPNYDDVLHPSAHGSWNSAGPGPVAFERAHARDSDTDADETSFVVTESSVSMPEEPVFTPAPTIVMPSVEPVTASPSPSVWTPEPIVAALSVAPSPVVPPPVEHSMPIVTRETPPAPVDETPVVIDEPMVRVAFDRVAAQLPPGVFVLPPARLGESLREPHTLLVPQRLVAPQLGEGAVEIPWTLVEDQFPDLALAMPRAEVRRRYPDWVVSLPMDEVLRQVPAELFQLSAPAADLSDIAGFEAPFKPGLPAPEAEPDAGPDPEPTPEPAMLGTGAGMELTPAEAEMPLFVPSADVPPPPPVPSHAPPPPVSPVPAYRPATVVAAASPVAPTRAPAPPAPAPRRTPPPAAPPEPPAPSVAGEPDAELLTLARALATPLASLGALEWQARRVGRRPLVCFVAPTLAREAIDALAGRGAAFLEHVSAWSIEQVTLRTSRIACVLTPLAGNGALATVVRRGGPVALLEIAAARAPGAVGRPGTPSLGVAPPTVSVKPVPPERSNSRLGEAARALAILGALTPTEVAAENGAPGVYVFARRSDATLVGAVRAVHDQLFVGHDDAGLGRLDSVVLRRGRERVIVRPLRGAEGAPAVLAAAGDMALTGRAQRAAARAATLLEAR